MNSLALCLFAVLALACAEPPSGYSYNRPSGGGGTFTSGQGGFNAGGDFSTGGGAVSSEGQNIDPQILEQVRQIILRSEASGGTGGVSSSYGAPAARIVDISLQGVRQAIQVAQFQQQSKGTPIAVPQGGYGRGPANGRPASSYGAPSSGGWN